jgi:hypothetical protein
MSKLSDLSGLLSKIDEEIAEERTRLMSLIDESQERVFALRMKRAKLADALGVITPAEQVSPQPKKPVEPSKVQVPPMSASEAILAALKATDGKGLSTIELRGKLEKRGISASASDKARTRLKGAKQIKLENDRWVLETGAEPATPPKS